MRVLNIRKLVEKSACLIAVWMLFVVLLSFFFIAVEANHECTGEDCPVCVCIEQCESALQKIGSGLIVLALQMAPVLLCFFAVLIPVIRIAKETPVLCKVRLNN